MDTWQIHFFPERIRMDDSCPESKSQGQTRGIGHAQLTRNAHGLRRKISLFLNERNFKCVLWNEIHDLKSESDEAIEDFLSRLASLDPHDPQRFGYRYWSGEDFALFEDGLNHFVSTFFKNQSN